MTMPKGRNPGAVNNPELLADLAANIKTAEQAMVNAEVYIAMLREAGENITQATKDLVQQKVRIDNWKRMLKKRGVDVDAIPLAEEE